MDVGWDFGAGSAGTRPEPGGWRGMNGDGAAIWKAGGEHRLTGCGPSLTLSRAAKDCQRLPGWRKLSRASVVSSQGHRLGTRWTVLRWVVSSS